jgi:hypothetical protein
MPPLVHQLFAMARDRHHGFRSSSPLGLPLWWWLVPATVTAQHQLAANGLTPLEQAAWWGVLALPAGFFNDLLRQRRRRNQLLAEEFLLDPGDSAALRRARRRWYGRPTPLEWNETTADPSGDCQRP